MMCASPKVAILLAAYQGMSWIEKQVDSILSQKGVSVTLFMSVDACPSHIDDDGTFVWCQQLAENHDNIHLLPYGQRFGRAGANFFRLIKEVDFSPYDAVALADQDDIWLEDKLCRAWECLSTSGCQVYSSNVIAFWSDGRRKLIKKSYQQRRYDHFFEAAGPGCTYVFCQTAAERLKNFLSEHNDGLNTIALHDWLAYAYCRHQGIRWFIDDQPTMLYRQHLDNEVGVNVGVAAHKKRVKQVFQKYYRGQVEAITNLVAPELVAKLQSRLFRLVHFRQFRRSPRDCLALLVMFLLCIY